MEKSEWITIEVNAYLTMWMSSFLYVLQPNATSVGVMSLNGPGQAKTVQTFNFAADAKKAGITINPNNIQGMSAFIKA